MSETEIQKNPPVKPDELLQATQICPRCKGRGTILVDISKSYGNRAERRRAMKAKLPMLKYFPCPDCLKQPQQFTSRVK